MPPPSTAPRARPPTGHVLLGEHTTASSAYVGMTRGRENNVAHLVAPDIDDARRQWDEVFSRDRADLGPAHAARLAAEDVERYGRIDRSTALAELRAAWTKEDELAEDPVESTFAVRCPAAQTCACPVRRTGGDRRRGRRTPGSDGRGRGPPR